MLYILFLCVIFIYTIVKYILIVIIFLIRNLDNIIFKIVKILNNTSKNCQKISHYDTETNRYIKRYMYILVCA